MRPFIIRFPDELHQQAKATAESQGVSLAAYIRQLVINDLASTRRVELTFDNGNPLNIHSPLKVTIRNVI